jgi:hypothetical protein
MQKKYVKKKSSFPTAYPDGIIVRGESLKLHTSAFGTSKLSWNRIMLPNLVKKYHVLEEKFRFIRYNTFLIFHFESVT